MLKIKQFDFRLFFLLAFFIFSIVLADSYEDVYPVVTTEKEPSINLEILEDSLNKAGIVHTLGNFQNGFDYYNGIENNSTEFALSYLVQQQNIDGSFGDDLYKLNNTAKFVLFLQNTNNTTSSEFSDALAYIISSVPKNNIERALKARVLFNEDNNAWQNIVDDILDSNNTNGGYGYKKGYNSDLITTLEVFETLRITNYNTDKFSKALVYILRKIEDNGEVYFIKGEKSSYYLANKLLEYLYPTRTYTVNADGETIIVQDKINVILTFLDLALDTNFNLLNSVESVDKAMTYKSFRLYDHGLDSIKEFKENILNEQKQDGSFGGISDTIDCMTSLVSSDLRISSVYTETVNPMNNADFVLKIDIKNEGYTKSHTAKLFIFVDNYLFWSTELTESQLPNINNTKSYQIDLTNTSKKFVGNVDFKVYIESDNEYQEKNNKRWKNLNINFAESSTGKPANPVWFVAHNYIDDNNSAGFQVSWGNKPDSLRDKYIILHRELGESQWAGSSFGYGVNNNETAHVVGLTNGVEYEIALGVLGTNGVLYLGSNIKNILVSTNEGNFLNSILVYMTNGLKRLYKGSINILGNDTEDIETDGYAYLSNIPTGSHVVSHNNPEYAYQLFSPFNISSTTTDDVRVFEYLLDDQESPNINDLTINGLDDGVAYTSTIHRIITNITDNNAVKNIDYYYYNPIETSWVFIGSNNTNTYDWFLPNAIYGTGFKIGIIATDYQGNQSNRFESASFEIQEPVYKISDVDGNGITNTTDSMLVLRYSLGLDMGGTNWKDFTNVGDVDCSGSVGSTDAMLIARYAIGLDLTNTSWCVQN